MFVPTLPVAKVKDIITTCMQIILVASMLYVFYVTQKSQCEANFTFDTTDSYIFSLSNDMTVIIVLVYMSSISHLYQNPRKACNWFNCDINWVLTNPKFSLKYTHKHDINNIFCDILCDLWHIISCASWKPIEGKVEKSKQVVKGKPSGRNIFSPRS